MGTSAAVGESSLDSHRSGMRPRCAAGLHCRPGASLTVLILDTTSSVDIGAEGTPGCEADRLSGSPSNRDRLQSGARLHSRMLAGGLSGVACSSAPQAGASVAVATDESASGDLRREERP